MATLTHGGRIVPILTGHEQHQQQLGSTTLSPDLLDGNSPRVAPQVAPRVAIDQLPLLDQRVESENMRQNKALDLSCLEMPCLKERGLFALPTEGDGKPNNNTTLHSLLPSGPNCSAPIKAISDASPPR